MRTPSGLDRARSLAATIVRGGLGDRVLSLGRRPVEPLLLYDFEACPHGRKVREAMSILDLSAHIRPVPKRGERYRPEARARAGKERFPILVDPNREGRLLQGSDVIVTELFAIYGDSPPPRRLRGGTIGVIASSIASGARIERGLFARPSRLPDGELELWQFEASPECRLVRETLSELELPYLSHAIAHGSSRRADFRARWGEVEVPLLDDRGAGMTMSGARAICEHLERSYCLR